MTLLPALVITAGTAALFYALGYSQGKLDGVEEWSRMFVEAVEKIVGMTNSLLEKLEERSE